MERPRHYRAKVAVLVVLTLALIVFALFNLSILPPPRLILRYGLPTGGPTGLTWTNDQGMVFSEVERGYFLFKPGPNSYSTRSSWLEVGSPMWVCTHIPDGDMVAAREFVEENPSEYRFATIHEEQAAWQIADGLWGYLLLRGPPSAR